MHQLCPASYAEGQAACPHPVPAIEKRFPPFEQVYHAKQKFYHESVVLGCKVSCFVHFWLEAVMSSQNLSPQPQMAFFLHLSPFFMGQRLTKNWHLGLGLKFVGWQDSERQELGLVAECWFVRGKGPPLSGPERKLTGIRTHEKHLNIATCKWCFQLDFGVEKQHVSNGCNMYLLRSPDKFVLFSTGDKFKPRLVLLQQKCLLTGLAL